MCDTTIANEHLKNSFKDFINYYFLKEDNKVNDKLPAYCREERQFALFLYNYLLKIVENNQGKVDQNDKVIKACGLSGAEKIKSVYYEVAFMRDFLHKEKYNANSNFNNELFKYIKSKIVDDKDLKWLIDPDKVKKLFDKYILADYKNELKENPFNIYNYNNKYEARSNVNYGSNVKDSVKDKGVEVDTLPYYIRILMRAMMNSKADIGIIYLDKDNNYHLKFIECKYESDESDVRLLPLKKDGSIKQPFVLRQTVIQYFITEFICNEICNKNINGKNFIADYPSIVIFSKEYGKIETKDLPKYYYSLTDEEGKNAIKTSTIKISDLVPSCLSNPIFPSID